ncbi:hypothetical protein ACT7DZ_37905 [Bacillus cereus]
MCFKDRKNGNVKIIMEHTSNETKEVNEKVKTHLVKSFKEKGFIGSEELIEKITASRFSNEKEMNFLSVYFVMMIAAHLFLKK